MKKGYIYKITSPTGKIYIGKTTNINNRKSSYRSLLCKNQRILYNSLVKHGYENHNLEILREGFFTREELSKLETYYIINFDSFVRWNDAGMNLTLGGEGCTVVHHSEETKKKISESKKGKPSTPAQQDYYQKQIGRKLPKSDEWIKNNSESRKKPIIQYDLEGNTIKEWKSAKDVEDNLGFNRKNISNNVTNKTFSAYGFIWKYKLDLNQRTKTNTKSGIKRKVVDIKTGDIYQSISEAAKQFQINPKTLALYLSGRLKNKTNLQYAE